MPKYVDISCSTIWEGACPGKKVPHFHFSYIFLRSFKKVCQPFQFQPNFKHLGSLFCTLGQKTQFFFSKNWIFNENSNSVLTCMCINMSNTREKQHIFQNLSSNFLSQQTAGVYVFFTSTVALKLDSKKE